VGLTTKSDATVMPIKMGPRNSIDVEAGWCLRDTAEAAQGGGLDLPLSRSEVQHEVRHFLAAPFEHDGGNAGAIPRGLRQVVAGRGHELLAVLGRIDGPGGFAVVETDDPALLARDTAIFSTFFAMTVYPVLDVQEAARIGGEALEFLRSA
jgi:hypothetical protein